ncbi:carboxypeptidase-like regulatory domain-containing protein [Cytophaga sp. FL35]|uniref:TonB-dependent receptor n=1 Tax=Cytophaga sp. FL35 TaxID=1904456 RepID=UPI001653DD0A|nr:carboxypeptidase-like regulatory domain-containing protein [Cytophaga sp. FL35]MBC6997876.1 carboxypeptidase-like regulatory domain-containing protein [Cytophaga sp. FL35]
MKWQASVLLYLLTLFVSVGYAQKANLTGIVTNELEEPLSDVSVHVGNQGTVTDPNGFYILEVPADRSIIVEFSHVGYKSAQLNELILNTNETFEFNPVLKENITQISEVTVSSLGRKKIEGITTISPEVIRKIPGANAGVENLLKLLPGVTSNNELSTQYSVRGGNYDENLVYINGIEVYRPFLIRSAQQEGLSFVNSDMVQNVAFSSGGFQAKYGDKLSSVLDITYKNPNDFDTQLDLSFLGASATVETASANKKFGSINGLRYRNNSLLVNSTQTEANFTPVFIDFQTYSNYKFSHKFHLSFLGNISVNDYQNEPLSRSTTFGTINDPRTLNVFYEGRENNQYKTTFGALKSTYFTNNQTIVHFTSSVYHTQEEEYSDVIASYALSPLEIGESGGASSPRGNGSQFKRARNDLDAVIVNIGHTGSHIKVEKKLSWGLKFTHENIRDQIRESEFLDSLGYSVRPPLTEFRNNQPYEPFEAPLVPFTGIYARNYVNTNRVSGFIQFSNRITFNSHEFYYNAGLRSQYWHIGGQSLNSASHFIWSPRFQLALKPNWSKDMLFRLSGGVYQQPPFYRELRDFNGNVHPETKAQKSVHWVASNEYSFTWWNRPFHLSSELYYKDLSQVNTYTLDDVRIRYVANNNATAYVYGADVRIQGAFVPGTESWLSLGFLRTEENSNNRGYIARPTDQRFKLGILYQDYIPQVPNFKMYLNLVYNTGVPGGSPSYTDPYNYQSRLRDYKRADLGISYIFADGNKSYPKGHWLHKFEELSAGLELFNMFNIQNSITNTWVRDVESKNQYAIPNFMTGRVLNLRVRMRF